SEQSEQDEHTPFARRELQGSSSSYGGTSTGGVSTEGVSPGAASGEISAGASPAPGASSSGAGASVSGPADGPSTSPSTNRVDRRSEIPSRPALRSLTPRSSTVTKLGVSSSRWRKVRRSA